MATQSGLKIVFGYTGADGITCSGLAGSLLQSHDFSVTHEKDKIKNAAGETCTKIRFDKMKSATLEVIPSHATLVSGARTNLTSLLALNGVIIDISACDDAPELVDSNWMVEDAKATGSNTGAHKVTLTLENHDLITASYA